MVPLGIKGVAAVDVSAPNAFAVDDVRCVVVRVWADGKPAEVLHDEPAVVGLSPTGVAVGSATSGLEEAQVARRFVSVLGQAEPARLRPRR